MIVATLVGSRSNQKMKSIVTQLFQKPSLTCSAVVNLKKVKNVSEKKPVLQARPAGRTSPFWWYNSSYEFHTLTQTKRSTWAKSFRQTVLDYES
jgi:hypothetical protein